MNRILLYIVSIVLILTYSCSEEDLDPTLAQSKAVETSINTVEDMQGIAFGMYNRFTATAYYGRNLIIYGEVRSDNTFSNGNSGRFVTIGQMTASPDGAYATDTWTAMYAAIASANILIQQNSDEIEGDVNEINHIQGQAYIARAMAHFDLLRLYGQQHAGGSLGVPYVTTYKGEELSPSRQSVNDNKNAIMSDIDTGLGLMSANLNDNSKQFITTHVAHALKARVALYFGDWDTAKSEAQAVVSSGAFSIAEAVDYASTWLIDGASNSIFELAYSSTDNNNINGLQYIYRGDSYGDIEVLDDLVSIFDEGDVRAAPEMIGPDPALLPDKEKISNLGKYPSPDYSDNISLIRYEEVVLILAEAKIELGEADALDILNLVPAKRNAQLYSEATKENVLLERRKELCFEGFRFDDLARTGSDIPLVDEFAQTHGGPAYGSYKFAFPIPTAELNANPNIVQNEGYN